MVEEKIRSCKQAGVKNQVSYKIQTDKPPLDEIISLGEEKNEFFHLGKSLTEISCRICA
jgi:hypothetical protein